MELLKEVKGWKREDLAKLCLEEMRARAEKGKDNSEWEKKREEIFLRKEE